MFCFYYLSTFFCPLYRILVMPCSFKCPSSHWVDPPGYGGYYQPEVTEFNPPEISYEEQEVPEGVSEHPYHALEHGYEYDV